MSKAIKISEENYRKLSKLSGKLREKMEKPVSIDDAITYLYSKRNVSDLAGTWDMSDEEAEEFLKDLKEGWKEWGKRSV